MSPTLPRRHANLPPVPSRRAWVCAAAAWPWQAAWAQLPGPVPGRTLTVGPGARYADLASAVNAATDGDSIEVLPGTYRGQVAVVEQRRLTVRGLGGGAMFEAAGRHAAGKGILVVRGDVTVQNLGFRGARVPDGNGAGIRHDRGRLEVRNCRFADNEMGLLASNEPSAELWVEDCVFSAAPRHRGLLHHLLYVGTIARFSLRGCRVEGGWRGHLVKSRARVNDISYNLLRDGPLGEASYELELANGGHNRVLGNSIVQGPRSRNNTVVAIGYNADPAHGHSLVFVHNTLVSEATFRARFLKLWTTQMQSLDPLHAANNLFVGLGDMGLPEGADRGGNVQMTLDALEGVTAGDFRPRASHLARHEPAPSLPPAWQPRYEYSEPAGTRRRKSPGSIGALDPAD